MESLEKKLKIKEEEVNKIKMSDTRGPDTSKSEKSQTMDICDCEQRISEVFKTFCNNTSLHGVKYVGEKGPITLRILWLLVVLAAFGAAIYHIYQVYSKWEETPAMVTISPRVKDIHEIYFPAVTICPPALLTRDLARELLNKSHPRYSQRKHIIDSYCENGAIPWHNIPNPGEEYGLWQNKTKVPCEVLMEEGLYPDGYGRWKKIATTHVNPSQSLVEQANLPCCTFNALSDDLMYKNLNITRERVIMKSRQFNMQSPKSEDVLAPTGIGIQNAFYFQMRNLHCIDKNAKFKISIHHPAEAPNVEGDGLIVKPGSEISFTVKPLQTESSENLKYLKKRDRECQFYDDVPLKYFKTYTQWNCKLDCLANMTIEACNCLPPYLPENNGTMKICKSGSDFSCYYSRHLQLRRRRDGLCPCEPACSEVTYLVETQYIPAEKEKINMVRFGVYFTENSFVSYQRLEYLGTSDFLASCGGLLGLFMGFSCISMIELLYFSIFGMWNAIFGTLISKLGRKMKT